MDLLRKWIDALRSGTYRQGFGQLRDADGCMCAQGVLLDVSGLGYWSGVTNYVVGFEWEDLDALALESLRDAIPLGRHSLLGEAMKMNDGERLPFAKIADELEGML